MAEVNAPHDSNEPPVEGSEVTYDLVCFPCDSAGEINEAEGYCTDCKEHMCAMCLKCHTRMSLTKHHKLADKDNMPRTQGQSVFRDVCTQLCQIHGDEVIKYYCPSHKALGCGVCMVSTHDMCKGKIHIPDEANNLPSSKEFEDFQAMMLKLIKQSDMIINSSKHSIEYVSACRGKALQEIETFRQEINDALDKLKASLEEQAEERVAQDKTMMTDTAEETSKIQEELQGLSSEMDTLLSKKQHCQMFIAMKTSERKLADFHQQLERLGTSHVTGFRFKPSDNLQNLVKAKEAFGELLLMNQAEVTATHVADIIVKTSENTKTCRIYGQDVISKGKLVITDYENATVKLIDTDSRQVLSEYKPDNIPYDVAAISSTQVAITIPDAQKIIFLRAEDILSLDTREINVDKQCFFITCMDDQLIVSFRSNTPSIGILSMEGELLQTFSISSTGEPLFSEAPCVTASNFSHVIYASNWKDNHVTMLDMEGHVLAEYRDDDLKTPGHSAVDDLGMVYVTGGNSYNMHVVTPDCRKVKVLLTRREGMVHPSTLSYCRDTGRLYVGMHKNDIIKVFQFA